MGETMTAPGGVGKTSHRILGIDTPLGEGALVAIRLDGEDALSRCFVYRVTVVSTVEDTAVESLLGRAVTLWLMPDGSDLRRPFHGLVRRVLGQGTDVHRRRLFRLEVVPRLWLLSHTADCRIFQNLSVPDILRAVFDDHGLEDVEFRTDHGSSVYSPLEYCVQYRESALNFVCRLMEHLGMFFWHEHYPNRHVLVIADRNHVAPACDPATVDIGSYGSPNRILGMEFDSTFRPGKWTLNDYDFEAPTKLLLIDTPTTLDVALMEQHEIYDYPGGFSDRDAGGWLTRLRMEMEEARHRRVFGTALHGGFDPGRTFGVTELRNGPEEQYLLTEVRHKATSPWLEPGDRDVAEYVNEFVAIPLAVPFRPEVVTPKPLIHSTQTATVVGPAGENIHCDEYGRVRVQFHWDRRGMRDEKSSCWLRVAQARAGAYYGDQVIPHVGHEVVVSFLEGDPDRPLITGSVPNSLTMPPMELPADKDKTIQRDHGDNKIVMNGKSGQEQVKLASPRRVSLFASGNSVRGVGSDALYTEEQLEARVYSLSSYKDQDGWDQLLGDWQGKDNSSLGCYLNSASEGKMNNLSIGNYNFWTYADSNSYIRGDSNTQVGQVDKNSTSTTTVYGTTVTENFGDSTSITTGDSTDITVGFSQEGFVGGKFEYTLAAAVEFTLGDSLEMFIGGKMEITVGAGLEIALSAEAEFKPLEVDENEAKIQDIGVQLDTVMTLLAEHDCRLETAETVIKNNGLDMTI